MLTLHDDRIGAITRFLDGDLPRRFGLPEGLHRVDDTRAHTPRSLAGGV